MTEAELIKVLESVADEMPPGLNTLEDAVDCEAQLLVLEDGVARWCSEHGLGAELPLDAAVEAAAEELGWPEPPIDAMTGLADLPNRGAYGELDDAATAEGDQWREEVQEWLHRVLPSEE